MSGRLAIIAALPREISGLVRGWIAHREHHHRGIFTWTSSEAIVVAAGMGAGRASLAVEAAISAGPVRQFLSVGLAGACDPLLRVGALIEATQVVDVRSGERFPGGSTSSTPCVLASGSSVASVREKARLFAAYGAAAVDMEAATVARLALAHNIPFRALKAVSDDFNFELSSLGRFTTKHGHFHTRAFAFHTAARPHTWAKTMKLGKHSTAALRVLVERLQQELHPTA